MGSLKHFYKFLKHQNPTLFAKAPLQTYSIYLSSLSNILETGSTVKSPIPISLFQRKFSVCAQLVSEDLIEVESTSFDECSKKLENNKKKRKKGQKHLVVEGNGVVAKSEEIEENGSLTKEVKKGDNGELPIDSKLKEIAELKRKLGKLEMEVRSLKGGGQNTEKKKKSFKNEDHPMVQSKPSSLHAVFTSKPCSLSSVNLKNSSNNKRPPAVSKQEQVSSYVKSKPLQKGRPIMKELSPEMVTLVSRWYEQGYLNKANFLPVKEFDLSSFANHYSHDFLRFAAEKFGQDHQEIAKWLSGNDFKTVALFGCPSVEKKTVFAAKRLRSFFRIQEDIVCRSCKVKSSCKFVNQRVWGKLDNLNLVDAMRVLTSYSLDSAPQLAIPKEVKGSISKLLKEVVNLSE